MGKFDKRAVGEKEGDRAPVGKRRKLAPVVDKSGSERTSQVRIGQCGQLMSFGSRASPKKMSKLIRRIVWSPTAVVAGHVLAAFIAHAGCLCAGCACGQDLAGAQ